MLISSEKKTVTVAVGVGATDVATLTKCLGAVGILVHAHDAATANSLVVTAIAGIGAVFPANGALTAVQDPAGLANSAAGRLFRFIAEYGTNSALGQIMTDIIKIQAAQAAGGGNVTFDIWVLY